MATLSSHVLDTSIGKPANNVKITLAIKLKDQWKELFSVYTNQDGRIDDVTFLSTTFSKGEYQLTFHIGDYFIEQDTFLNQVPVQFLLSGDEHFHVPLVVSPFSYSTYRGS